MEVNAAMESARAQMDGINLLVNCAGVVGAGRVLGKNGPMAGDFFAKVVHINLIGTFLCDKAAAAIMQNNAPTEDGEPSERRVDGEHSATPSAPREGAEGMARCSRGTAPGGSHG